MTRIADYNDAECDLLFKFKKTHLEEMVNLLRFPEYVRFSNRVTITGEEIMLRGLYEMNSRDTQYKISRHFGRCWTMQSRAWTFFVHHMYSEHHHLVHDSLPWWHRNRLLHASRDSIWAKISGEPCKIWERSSCWLFDPFNTGLFIDCNCFSCCRVGGGPAEEGPDAMRWFDEIQHAFYNRATQS